MFENDKDFPFFVQAGVNGAKFDGDDCYTIHYEIQMKREWFDTHEWDGDYTDLIEDKIREFYKDELKGINCSYSPTGKWFTSGLEIIKVPRRNMYILLVFRLQDL